MLYLQKRHLCFDFNFFDLKNMINFQYYFYVVSLIIQKKAKESMIHFLVVFLQLRCYQT
jgi:hypothetical protein